MKKANIRGRNLNVSKREYGLFTETQDGLTSIDFERDIIDAIRGVLRDGNNIIDFDINIVVKTSGMTITEEDA